MNPGATESALVLRGVKGTLCAVTGAARGIGFVIAEHLAAQGARVACLDVSERRLQSVMAKLGGAGSAIRGYHCDVSSRSDVAAVFARIASDFDAPVKVLVNNAMWTRFQPLAEIDDETMERTIAVGLKSLVFTMQAAVPGMKVSGGGSIVNFSSVGALRPVENSIVYAAVKSAVLGLTRAAAVELGKHRIRVNAVLPGMIGTEAALGNFDEATLERRRSRIPLGRFGEPAEIAEAVGFLASESSLYVQGSSFAIDGGWSIAAA